MSLPDTLVSELTELFGSAELEKRPAEYRKAYGRCPPGFHWDGTNCTKVDQGGKAPAPAAAEKPAPEKAAKKPEPAEKPTKAAPAPEPKAGSGSSGAAIAAEETVPPPGGHKAYAPNPSQDVNGDGITDASRVGLCGSCTAPPAKIPRLPNLTSEERAAETRFAEAFESDPDGLAAHYKKRLEAGDLGEAPHIYAMDDAKLLSPDYNPDAPPASQDQVFTGRATMNVVVHQTANAICKKAFLSKLDELAKLPAADPKRSVLVTQGGIASGKGFSLGNVPEAKQVADAVGAVWDSAGEQNGTESPWVAEECRKRGIKATFAYIDADPKVTWTGTKERGGAVQRANKIGRMVDARLFADSYAMGAQNFAAFSKAVADDPGVETMVISSRKGKPALVDGVPGEALSKPADSIYSEATAALDTVEDLKPAVRRGGVIGHRIWGPPTAAKQEARVSDVADEVDLVLEAASKPRPKAKPLSKAAKAMAEAMVHNLTQGLNDPEAADKIDEKRRKLKSIVMDFAPPAELNPDGSLKKGRKK